MPRSKKTNKSVILEWDGSESENPRTSIPAWRPGTMFSIPSSIIDPQLPPAHRKNQHLLFCVANIAPHPTEADKHKITSVILDKEKNPTKEFIEFNYKSGLSTASIFHGHKSM